MYTFNQNMEAIGCNSITGERLKTKQGEVAYIDNMIFCSGYFSSIFHLKPEPLAELYDNAHDSFSLFVLYKDRLHPHMQNDAFVGIYPGPYVESIKTQSQWPAKSFSKKRYWTEKPWQYTSIAEALRSRLQTDKPQISHEEPTGFTDADPMKMKTDTASHSSTKVSIPASYRKPSTSNAISQSSLESYVSFQT